MRRLTTAAALLTCCFLLLSLALLGWRPAGFLYQTTGTPGPPQGSPRLTHVSWRGKLLELEVTGLPEANWILQGASGALPLEGLAIPLEPGIHNYRLTPDSGGTTIELVVDTITEADGRVYNVDILDSNLEISGTRRAPLEDSCYSRAHFVREELERARRLLVETGYYQLSSDARRVRAIVEFILDEVGEQIGTPSPELANCSPLEMFDCARRGESKLWCTNLSSIYLLFATSVDLPSRSVLAGSLDFGATLGAHTFCETYLADEGDWGIVDVRFRTALYRGPGGKLLNANELRELGRLGSGFWASVEADTFGTYGGEKTAPALETRSVRPFQDLIYPRPTRNRPFAKLMQFFWYPHRIEPSGEFSTWPRSVWQTLGISLLVGWIAVGFTVYRRSSTRLSIGRGGFTGRARRAH